MKADRFLIALLLASSLLLPSCAKSSSDGAGDPDIPENGIYYEYSSGGNSDRIVSRTTYEDSVAVSVDEYEYWPTGELKTVTTTVNGTVTDIWNYQFSSGILAQMVHEFNEAGYECRDDYRYNEDGTISELIYYTDDEYSGGCRYSYNTDGVLILEEQLDRNGDVITYTEYTLNENGDTASSHYYQYGSVSSYSIYEYTADKKLTQITNYSFADEITSKSIYTYGPDGNITRISILDANDTLTGYTECLYDESGFHYRDIYYENGKPVYCYDYTEDGIPVYKAY